MLVCQKAADALKTMPTQTLETQVNLSEMCHQHTPDIIQDLEDRQDRDKMTAAPENWSLGKSQSESLGGYLKSAALSRGPGGVRGELALNSCCAHCDKIERGIERNRRHSKPVFRPAEHAANSEQL